MKRNQIMITTLAVMIAIAGYLTFMGNSSVTEQVVVKDEILVEDEMTALLDLSEEDIVSDLEEEQTNIESLDQEAVLTENYMEETMVSQIEQESINYCNRCSSSCTCSCSRCCSCRQ